MKQVYLQTARLLTKVAPLVFTDDAFALKGGTAINLFVRELPRLSVDLDVVLVDYTLTRDQAVSEINRFIRATAERLRRYGMETHAPKNAFGETKLLVRQDDVEVKVETNLILRGTVQPVSNKPLTQMATNVLLADVEVPVVSFEDMYGGKLVAALDRQHPRDLFDVMQLLSNEGITADVRQAFVVYLACHNRPVHEVLSPVIRDITYDYESTFAGMTRDIVELNDLVATRQKMIKILHEELSVSERNFLLSLVSAEPQWDLIAVPHLKCLPGIRWKLQNIKKLKETQPAKFAKQIADLHNLLF